MNIGERPPVTYGQAKGGEFPRRRLRGTRAGADATGCAELYRIVSLTMEKMLKKRYAWTAGTVVITLVAVASVLRSGDGPVDRDRMPAAARQRHQVCRTGDRPHRGGIAQ